MDQDCDTKDKSEIEEYYREKTGFNPSQAFMRAERSLRSPSPDKISEFDGYKRKLDSGIERIVATYESEFLNEQERFMAEYNSEERKTLDAMSPDRRNALTHSQRYQSHNVQLKESLREQLETNKIILRNKLLKAQTNKLRAYLARKARSNTRLEEPPLAEHQYAESNTSSIKNLSRKNESLMSKNLKNDSSSHISTVSRSRILKSPLKTASPPRQPLLEQDNHSPTSQSLPANRQRHRVPHLDLTLQSIPTINVTCESTLPMSPALGNRSEDAESRVTDELRRTIEMLMKLNNSSSSARHNEDVKQFNNCNLHILRITLQAYNEMGKLLQARSKDIVRAIEQRMHKKHPSAEEALKSVHSDSSSYSREHKNLGSVRAYHDDAQEGPPHLITKHKIKRRALVIPGPNSRPRRPIRNKSTKTRRKRPSVPKRRNPKKPSTKRRHSMTRSRSGILRKHKTAIIRSQSRPNLFSTIGSRPVRSAFRRRLPTKNR